MKALEGTWRHLKALEGTWRLLKVLEGTWRQLKALEGTWKHLKALEGTWKHLKALEGTWRHLKALEGTSLGIIDERESALQHIFYNSLTISVQPPLSSFTPFKGLKLSNLISPASSTAILLPDLLHDTAVGARIPLNPSSPCPRFLTCSPDLFQT